jgi:hypothetical protein
MYWGSDLPQVDEYRHGFLHGRRLSAKCGEPSGTMGLETAHVIKWAEGDSPFSSSSWCVEMAEWHRFGQSTDLQARATQHSGLLFRLAAGRAQLLFRCPLHSPAAL